MKRRGEARKAVADADGLAAMRKECRRASKSAVRLMRLMRGNPQAAASVPLRDITHMLAVTSSAGRTYANILKGLEAHNGD